MNEELDALMFLAYIIENIFKKTKRLKLVEVIHLLKEITNIEMDLRFEAAAASELYENTKNDSYIKVPKIYWGYTSKQVLALDKIDEISVTWFGLILNRFRHILFGCLNVHFL